MEKNRVHEAPIHSKSLGNASQIIDQVHGSVIVVDMEGYIVSWNRDSTRIYGYTPEEAIGKHIELIYPPEEQDTLRNHIMHPLLEQGELDVEVQAWNKAGDRFPTRLSLSVQRNDSGTVIGMIGYSQDITEPKRIEAQRKHFQDILYNTPEAVATAPIDTGILNYVNPAYCDLLGYREDELIGNPVTFVFGESPEYIMEKFTKCAQKGFWKGEMRYRKKDGTIIPCFLSANVLYAADDTPQTVVGFTRDLTEQKRQEAERVALQQQVIEAQRAALRELSSPLIPLSDKVVLMPLIGSIDSTRAQMVMETMLEGIAKHRADVAIVDITGVLVLDTQIANALIQAAQAVRLLGAQVILTGIGPAMAQTLVELGADLSNIITQGSLQRAIQEAMQMY